MSTKILTRAEIEALITMAEVIPAVESAFRAHGEGAALMPPKLYIDLPEHDGDFRAMPAAMGDAAGVKWVNSHPMNPARSGLPSVMGVYILSDPKTAYPLAIMDATWLTALRTGAAAAVASKYLAKPQPRTLGLVGAGVQAEVLLSAHRALYGDALDVLVADRDAAVADAFAASHQAKATTTALASGADIVCTSTPSKEPVVRREWVKPGAHINAMGADAEGKQELETTLLQDGRVFVDDWAQASHSGEINVPLHQGRITQSAIAGALGEVIIGKRSGRQGDEVTVFDSTGLALQDVATARAIYELAKARGVGLDVDLVGAGR